MTVLADIFDRLAEAGRQRYGGEAVSQLDHALQCAQCAQRDRAPRACIAAALLHDIGHLLHDAPEDVAGQGIDMRHEMLAHCFLAAHFVPAVAEAVRLHVDAKRYLCAVDPAYLLRLSPTSRQSLALQGGPFTAAQSAAFEALPFAAAATALRRWDDEAKIPGLATPSLLSYRALVASCLK
jgi:phosphonate degradation associated HDIG domain protein